MGELPKLKQDDIRAWVGERSFERARSYVQGALFNQRRQGATLKAQCQGSLPHAYAVEATLGSAGIASADCSCPVGDGGACKHVGALLLSWLAEPGDFVEIEELEPALAKLDKPALVALVRQMVARHPDLELLLNLAPVGAGATAKPIDVRVIKRQVQAAIDSGGDEWGDSYGVAQDLEGVVQLGEEYAARQDLFNAALTYETTAKEILERYEELGDEEGEIADVVNECVSGLAGCLEQLTDRGQRETVLRALFDIYIWDLEFGGIGIGDDVPDILTEQTSAEEREGVVEWARDATPAGKDWSQSWRRQALGGLLLALQRDKLDDEAFLRIARENGRTSELIVRLLDLGRLDQALKDIRALDDAKLLEMATLLRAKGYAEPGEQLVRERLPRAQHKDGMLEWLKRLARERGDTAEALQIAETLFWQRPTLAGYDELKDLAEQGGVWDELRAELVERLAEEGKYALLTELHLRSGEVAQALQTLPRVAGWDGYGEQPLHIRVAQAAEASRPFEAIPIYVAAAERLIGQQGRENYATAARYLVRVREIYKHVSQPEPWQQLIAGIREQHKRLRALQEELTKAGL